MTEFVAEHHLLIRAHEPVVSGLGRDVGDVVAVLASVQVRTADAARQHVEQQLALGRYGGGQFYDLELRIAAADRFHAPQPTSPVRRWCGLWWRRWDCTCTAPNVPTPSPTAWAHCWRPPADPFTQELVLVPA